MRIDSYIPVIYLQTPSCMCTCILCRYVWPKTLGSSMLPQSVSLTAKRWDPAVQPIKARYRFRNTRGATNFERQEAMCNNSNLENDASWSYMIHLNFSFLEDPLQSLQCNATRLLQRWITPPAKMCRWPVATVCLRMGDLGGKRRDPGSATISAIEISTTLVHRQESVPDVVPWMIFPCDKVGSFETGLMIMI